MTAAEIGYLLVGALIGACGVFILTGLALWFVDVRRAVVEGNRHLDGVELERAKRRES